MIIVINVEVKCNNDGDITAINMKFRKKGDKPKEANIPAIIASALAKTTFISDTGNKGLTFKQNGNRKEIFDLTIKIGSKGLTFKDVGTFIDYFKEKLITEQEI